MCDFSIIIPAYNDLDLFRYAFNSVINQTGIDFEIIVNDDSTGNDIEIFVRENNDSRVHYMHNIPPLGAVKNWNSGLELAKGDHIILLHHDERLTDKHQFLFKALSIFKKSSLDILIAEIAVKQDDNQSNRRIKLSKRSRQLIVNYFPSVLFLANVIGPPSCVILKNCNIKMFDEKLNWLVDVDWYYNHFISSKVGIVSDLIIASSDGHSNQISKNIDIPKFESLERSILMHKHKTVSIALALNIRRLIFNLNLNKVFNRLFLWNSNKNNCL